MGEPSKPEVPASWPRYELLLLCRGRRESFWSSWLHLLVVAIMLALATLVASIPSGWFGKVLVFFAVLGVAYLVMLLALLVRQPHRHAQELAAFAASRVQEPNASDALTLRHIRRMSHEVGELCSTLSASSSPESVERFKSLRLAMLQESRRLGGRYPMIADEIEHLLKGCTPWYGVGEKPLTDEEMREWSTVPLSRCVESLQLFCSDALKGNLKPPVDPPPPKSGS